MPNKHRSEDEVTLHILDLHDEGMEPEQIGKILGLSTRTVRRRLADVIADDVLHDPDASSFWLKPRKET